MSTTAAHLSAAPPTRDCRIRFGRELSAGMAKPVGRICIRAAGQPAEMIERPV
jgi:hypothetical protein